MYDKSLPSGQPLSGGVRQPREHDSARKQLTGAARYISDLVPPADTLHVYVAYSSEAHAQITHMALDQVAAARGVVTVLTAQDIPGINDVGPVIVGDPVFAETHVQYPGQSLFAVVATSLDCARRAARLAEIQYQPLDAIVDVETALQQQSFVLDSKTLVQGNADSAIVSAPHRLQGTLRIGGQDHFYLEGQAALAVPGEDAEVRVFSSTQHPREVQHCCARVLGVADHNVTVEARRLGGAFGGKESQPALFAAIAALAAKKTGQAVSVVLDRDDDMIMTGKRHDFLTRYDVGFNDQGVIQAIMIELASRCGMSADLSGPINDRALFHCDNAYFLENVRIRSHRCKTHTVSNTAFRGFGGPQGMMVIERVMEDIARSLDKDPLEVRKANLYGIESRNTTPYGMTVEDNVLGRLFATLEASADYWERRQQINAFNSKSPVLKKGLALTPVKFGISFNTPHLNQAGALLHIYTDGSIMLNHGGVEMGQGLNTKVAQVVAEELQVDIEHIKITATSTDKVPNTSATAASSGSDLNGKAAQAAAATLKKRLTAFAAQHYQVDSADIIFLPNRICIGKQVIRFKDLVMQAYLGRIPLSATGYYRTPKIYFDAEKGQGRPFFYFAYGASVSEVLVDTLTGEYRVERVDIVHDCGSSINPALDLGQIEGGFIQGMGWLTTEELVFDDRGHLRTHAPSTYKIPTCADRPAVMNIAMLRDNANAEDTIHRSKAVGEPPLMLAISVFHALNDAIASLGEGRVRPILDAPATPERVLMACEALRGRRADSQ